LVGGGAGSNLATISDCMRSTGCNPHISEDRFGIHRSVSLWHFCSQPEEAIVRENTDRDLIFQGRHCTILYNHPKHNNNQDLSSIIKL
jgi:hypothetical protein